MLARPLVPRRLGPRPRRRTRLPALPHHRQGPLPGRPLHRRRARRRDRPRDRRELGRRDRRPHGPHQAAHRLRLSPARQGLRRTRPRRWLGRAGDPYGHGLDAWLVEFGPDVVVLEPAELRAEVVDRLRAVAKG
ncbi:WCX domain-containing protein [Streptomyces aureus]